MDALYVIIEDGRLSPLSFDSTQSTLIFPAQQAPVEVGNALLHELEDDLAALVEVTAAQKLILRTWQMLAKPLLMAG
nr:unnamed protein product [Callosobruchus analis]